MPEKTVLENILGVAIQREEAAAALYDGAAKQVEPGPVLDLLIELKQQEIGHKLRLQSLLDKGTFRRISAVQRRQVEDLKLTDYLKEESLAPDTDLQGVLIVAGKREKASHDLYAGLAQVTDDPEVNELFRFLANEELGHKHRIETMYEELFLQDN